MAVTGTLLRTMHGGRSQVCVPPRWLLSCAGFCVCGAARGKKNEGGAAMFSGLSRLRLLSVLLPLVLVAPPLGGRLSDRLAVPAASSRPTRTTNTLDDVACLSPSTCVAVGSRGTILRSTDGGSTWRRQNNPISGTTNTVVGVACASPSTCVAVG